VYHKGTNRSAFLLGQVDKYSWVDTGSSFGLSDVLAAYLYGQLEEREAILGRRRALWERYQAALGPKADAWGLRLPVVPADRVQGYHMYHLMLPDGATRNRVLAELEAREVHATFHYVPLHSSKGGRAVAAREVACPVTDDVSARLLRLPFYTGITVDEVERVLDALIRALDPG
jgi:dTDP-4-amino-4,6-dideoxygalactose transaminase